MIANTALLALGTIEIIPPVAPLTLFIWGPKRVLPVRLTEFSITEEAYDPTLNPIRAKVSLGLRVLSYSDLPLTHPGYSLFLAHQVVKEAMATIGSVREPRATSADGGVEPARRRCSSRPAATPPSRPRRCATPDGRAVAYKRRRFLPQGATLPLLVEVDGRPGRPARPDHRPHARRPRAVLAGLRRQRRPRPRRADEPRLRPAACRVPVPAAMRALLGIRLTLLIGPTVAVPAPPPLIEALHEVEVTHSDDGQSGFQLTFQRRPRGPGRRCSTTRCCSTRCCGRSTG